MPRCPIWRARWSEHLHKDAGGECLAPTFRPVIHHENAVLPDKRRLHAQSGPLAPVVLCGRGLHLCAWQQARPLLTDADEPRSERNGGRASEEEASGLDTDDMRDPQPLPRSRQALHDVLERAPVCEDPPHVGVALHPTELVQYGGTSGARHQPNVGPVGCTRRPVNYWQMRLAGRGFRKAKDDWTSSRSGGDDARSHPCPRALTSS